MISKMNALFLSTVVHVVVNAKIYLTTPTNCNVLKSIIINYATVEPCSQHTRVRDSQSISAYLLHIGNKHSSSEPVQNLSLLMFICNTMYLVLVLHAAF